MNGAGEQVYVVRRLDLFPGGAPQGYVPGCTTSFGSIREHGFFAPRESVEEDPSLKQIIPYAVVARGCEVFLFRRSRGGGESRLHGLRSIGVGGHVNPVDEGEILARALRREAEEELELPAGWVSRFVGLLNDDTTAVGSVHLGVVAVIEPGKGEVRVREEDTMSGSFWRKADLLDLHARERESFESWSALLLDRIDEVLAWEPPRVSSSRIPSPTRISTT